MQCLEQQQMQPDATNPALSATLPQPGAEQMREAAPVASHAAKISHGNDGPALQLMPRAAMPLPSNEPESPKSDYGGEYCMRLVSHAECFSAVYILYIFHLQFFVRLYRCTAHCCHDDNMMSTTMVGLVAGLAGLAMH